MKDIPIVVEDFLNYMETIKGASSNTVKEYYYDLRTFLRFLKLRYRLVENSISFEQIDVSDLDIDFFNKVNLQDLHAYIAYVDKEKNNSNAAKSRKVASVRSFFTYLNGVINVIDNNPADFLETPKTKNRQPVFLTLGEARKLLNAVKSNENDFFRKRDYAILTLFLNCGLRLSELVSIDISKIKKDTLTVIGKGNKERTVYLNEACISAINDYLAVRPGNALDKNALFLSLRKTRISTRAVQHMVDRYLKKAGLDPSVYSTHTLRHTAATLMYQHGNVDIRALQEILGHEDVSTTQIYTHINKERLRDAVQSNPLSEAGEKPS